MQNILLYCFASLIAIYTFNVVADDLHVPAQFNTIQAAIYSAQDGDRVLVADGVYQEEITFLGKAITVESENGPENCILKTPHEYFWRGIGCTFENSETSDSILRGMQVLMWAHAIKIVEADPLIENCWITENWTTNEEDEDVKGGGLVNLGGSPTINDCLFYHNGSGDYENHQDGTGGGIYTEVGNLKISNTRFERNFAVDYYGEGGGWGGAIQLSSGHLEIDHCDFIQNGGSGGAIMKSGGTLFITNCNFIDNGGSLAGALWLWGGATIQSCLFDSCSTYNGRGGAISCSSGTYILNSIFTNNQSSSSSESWTGGGAIASSGGTTIVNCLIAGNTATSGQGGGLYLGSNDKVINSTIVDNTFTRERSGGGIYFERISATVTNSIIWGNTDDQIGGVRGSISYSCVEGGYEGIGNISDDPKFVDFGNGVYSLQYGSPCIDAADNSAVPLDIYDLDKDGDIKEPLPFDLLNNPRFIDDPATEDTGFGDPPLVDMGVYEFIPADTIVIDVNIINGSILSGDIVEIYASDDTYIHTRSDFGQTVVDLHNMEMIVNAVTTVDNATTLNLTIESRIDEPAGLAQIRLRNWNTNLFDSVGSYSLGNTDSIDTINGIDATNYINGSGNIDLSIKHLVFVPFLAFTFESFLDQVEITVN